MPAHNATMANLDALHVNLAPLDAMQTITHKARGVSKIQAKSPTVAAKRFSCVMHVSYQKTGL